MKRGGIIWITLSIPWLIFAQDPLITLMEVSLFDQDPQGSGGSSIEKLEELLDEPIDLNRADKIALESSGLFTPFQVYGILDCREKHGSLLSIYELSAIPGFQRSRIESIKPFITTLPPTSSGYQGRNSLLLLSNLELTYPLSKGYSRGGIGSSREDGSSWKDGSSAENSGYTGGPFKQCDRIRIQQSGFLQLGYAYDKDPGESWLNGTMPEHHSGFLCYSPGKLLRKVIVGNFRLHRGTGIVNGTGFSSLPRWFGMSNYNMAYARPVATTAEYGYYTGGYISGGFKGLSWDLFISKTKEDLSPSSLLHQSDLFKSIRQTGLHRTLSEKQGSDLGSNLSRGLSVQWAAKKYSLGFAYGAGTLKLTSEAMRTLQLRQEMQTQHWNLTWFGNYVGGKSQIIGEYAIDQMRKSALLLGYQYDLNPALWITLFYRDYSPEFTGQKPVALSAGLDPENERGITWKVNMNPANHWEIRLLSDLGAVIDPGWDHDAESGPKLKNSIQVLWDAGEIWQLEGIYLESRTLKPAISVRSSLNRPTTIAKFRLHLKATMDFGIVAQTRFECSSFIPVRRGDMGQLIYQQIDFKREHLSVTYRFVLFNIPVYDLRIYTYEPALRYAFSSPAFSGKGIRNVIRISTSLKNKRITLRTKIGVSKYAYTHSLGTGNEQRPGSVKGYLGFQFQYRK